MTFHGNQLLLRSRIDLAVLTAVACVVLSLFSWQICAFQQQPNIAASNHPLKTSSKQILPSKSQLYVKSKFPKTRKRANYDDDDVDDDNYGGSKLSPWTNFKKLVYDGVDGVSSVLKADDENSMDNNVQKGRVSQGYNANIDATLRTKGVPMSPAERILMNQRLGSGNVRQGAGVRSAQQKLQEERERRDSKSSFDNFKSGVYGVVDFVTGPAPSRPKKTVQKEEEAGISVETTLAVPSKPSFNQIREQEARARAEVRNEKIRAKKEDLYKIVDSLQATVDSLPETFDAAEEAVKEAISFSKTIPEKVEKTVQEIQAIPDKFEQKAAATQKSIENNLEKTKKIVIEAQDIPNKVSKSVQNTKQTIANTQETVSDAVTSVKVLVGLEKPKPKPPKKPPPPKKKPKEIALDLAGKAAGATGKLAWWTGKNAASLAWKGAKVAFDKSVETIGPAMEEAMKQQQQVNKDKAPTPKPPSSPPPPSTAAMAATGTQTNQQNAPYKNIKTPEELAQEVAQAQALAKEVEEALEMAERALLISNLDKTRPDDIQKLKKK
jgi:DNA-binding protein H-NS